MYKIEEEVLKKALREAYLEGIKDCETQTGFSARTQHPERGVATGMMVILEREYGAP